MTYHFDRRAIMRDAWGRYRDGVRLRLGWSFAQCLPLVGVQRKMPKSEPIPSQKLLRQILDYNPNTGILTWKERPPELFANAKNPVAYAKTWNKQNAGKTAGAKSNNGRLQICVQNRNYNAHKIIWIWLYGTWNPLYEIDHINGDPSDNRQSNLRLATSWQNKANRNAMFEHNTSGALGVTFDRRSSPLKKRWLAQIKVCGAYLYLGRFETREEAQKAYMDAKTFFLGDYASAPTNRDPSVAGLRSPKHGV